MNSICSSIFAYLYVRGWCRVAPLCIVVLFVGACGGSLDTGGLVSDEGTPAVDAAEVTNTPESPGATLSVPTTLPVSVAESSSLPATSTAFSVSMASSSDSVLDAHADVSEPVPSSESMSIEPSEVAGEAEPSDAAGTLSATPVTEAPDPLFRGVVRAASSGADEDSVLVLRFLDSRSGAVTEMEVDIPSVVSCHVFLASAESGVFLAYEQTGLEDFGFGVSHIEWGEEPVELADESSGTVRELFWSRHDRELYSFDVSDGTVRLTEFDNGFSVEAGDMVREYLVRWPNHTHFAEQFTIQEVPEEYDEQNVWMEYPVGGGYENSRWREHDGTLVGNGKQNRWSARLLGFDGEMFAVSLQSSEPACGWAHAYFISRRTGDVIYCTVTHAAFRVIFPPDDSWRGDGIGLWSSGFLRDEPCMDEDADLNALAHALANQ